MTAEFLAFSVAQGNDLVDADAAVRLPGTAARATAGACARRAWQEAFEAGAAPPVHLAATHARALEWCSLDALRAHAVDV